MLLSTPLPAISLLQLVSENRDQRALRLWLTAGLQIPEVVSLHGDANYLLNNMIAKYTLAEDAYRISVQALQAFQDHGVDLRQTYTRSRFYGKGSGFMYEHAVPAQVLRQALLAGRATESSVAAVLRSAGPVAVLLREENQHLRAAGLNAKMPDGWVLGDDPLARYNAVGIALSDQVLRVKGAICR